MKAAWEQLGDEVCYYATRFRDLLIFSILAPSLSLLATLIALLKLTFAQSMVFPDIQRLSTGRTASPTLTMEEEISIR
jgi:hypothetical protein